jgi:hypothetical protein
MAIAAPPDPLLHFATHLAWTSVYVSWHLLRNQGQITPIPVGAPLRPPVFSGTVRHPGFTSTQPPRPHAIAFPPGAAGFGRSTASFAGGNDRVAVFGACFWHFPPSPSFSPAGHIMATHRSPSARNPVSQTIGHILEALVLIASSASTLADCVTTFMPEYLLKFSIERCDATFQFPSTVPV